MKWKYKLIHDYLKGLKENVIVGHLIPAGTGSRDYNDLIVYQEREYDNLLNDGKNSDSNQSVDLNNELKESNVRK